MHTILRQKLKTGVFAFKENTGQHSDLTMVLHYKAEVLDRDLVGGDPVNFVDPWGLAQIGGRPLDSNDIPFNGRGPLRHDQIWYDNGTNSGFFDDDSIRPDNGHNIGDYDFSRDPRHYEDWIMREAENNVQRNWDMDWRMPIGQRWNNCQDYTDAVRDEYNSISDAYNRLMGYPSGGTR